METTSLTLEQKIALLSWLVRRELSDYVDFILQKYNDNNPSESSNGEECSVDNNNLLTN